MNFKTASYVPNMIAALGTTRIMCGTNPPYNAASPSSRNMRRKHWIRPVYFGGLPSAGFWRRRVLTTWERGVSDVVVVVGEYSVFLVFEGIWGLKGGFSGDD